MSNPILKAAIIGEPTYPLDITKLSGGFGSGLGDWNGYHGYPQLKDGGSGECAAITFGGYNNDQPDRLSDYGWGSFTFLDRQNDFDSAAGTIDTCRRLYYDGTSGLTRGFDYILRAARWKQRDFYWYGMIDGPSTWTVKFTMADGRKSPVTLTLPNNSTRFGIKASFAAIQDDTAITAHFLNTNSQSGIVHFAPVIITPDAIRKGPKSS